jgi:hypothetical protein
MRPDQSDYLAHFTKGERAYDNLVSILKDGVVYAGNLPWTGKPAVCFTECPWGSLLAHATQYSPYGVGFTKPHVFAAGGGPAFYVRADHYKKQDWAEHAHTFVTPFWPRYRPATLKGAEHLGGKTIDYAHEREWRVPHPFSFTPEQVQFVVLDTYEDMAKFPKELKDAIGREKFILMDMYRKVEQLWPTHIVD